MNQARIMLDSAMPSDIVKGDVPELSEEEEATKGEESGEWCRKFVARFQATGEIEETEVLAIASAKTRREWTRVRMLG